MKALQINSYGNVDTLILNPNTPMPSSDKSHALIKIHAISLNPFDILIRNGILKEQIPLTLPFTLGGDFAGTIVETGEEVFGSAIVVSGGSGAIADYASVPLEKLAKKPPQINFAEAASLVLVGTSAIQAIEEHMQIKSKQKILIHGGSGGIGSVAIQLAKSKGAYVATTARTNDIDHVKQLGADEVIDFSRHAFETVLQNYDAVLDTVGGETTRKSFLILKPGSILVSMKGKPDQQLADQLHITAIGQSTGVNTVRLERLANLVSRKIITPRVDQIFSLNDAKKAFIKLETGHPKGKIVIRII